MSGIKHTTSVNTAHLAGRAPLRTADRTIKTSGSFIRESQRASAAAVSDGNSVYESRQNPEQYGADSIKYAASKAESRAVAAGRKAAQLSVKRAKIASNYCPDINSAIKAGSSKIKTVHSELKSAHKTVKAARQTAQSKAMIRQAQKKLFEAHKRLAKTVGKAAARICRETVKAAVKLLALVISSIGLLGTLLIVFVLGGAIIMFSFSDPDNPPESKPVMANAIYYYLRTEAGLNSAAACGVLANIEAEGNFNLTALGDEGTSFGLCQWHNERWDRLIQFCADKGYSSSSLIGQLEYLYWELQTYYSPLLDYLRSVENDMGGCYDAAYHFCTDFEKPLYASIKADERGGLALQNYWTTFGLYEAAGDWTAQGMKLAMTAYNEIGNSGGAKYWSWYGFPKRVEWCAIFVSWCGAQNGYIASGIMPLSANVDHYINGAQWYYNNSDVLIAQPDAYPAPGMVAFFGRGHTGIVFGSTAESVFLVEGNSGDTVAMREYALPNIRDDIWGYGIPKFAY